MTQQKSEDRVVLEGGVTPAELVGSSPGGQGKAIPVDQTAVQLELPIATAEHHTGSGTGPGMGRVVVPKAIVNAEIGTAVTMEEVVGRLTTALLKVVLNKGAPGSDGQTVEALRRRSPGPLAADAPVRGEALVRRRRDRPVRRRHRNRRSGSGEMVTRSPASPPSRRAGWPVDPDGAPC